MAANRTFQFKGIGVGDTPVTVTATVAGTQIFSGVIPTVPSTVDPGVYPTQDNEYTTTAFTLDDSSVYNTDFAGSVPMTIEISGGNLAIFTEIFCNYYAGNVTTDPNAGTVDHFGSCYYGVPVNSESTPDPRSSVYVDGAQQVPPAEVSKGCWAWGVDSPGTLTYNWNIGVGQIGNVSGNSAAYIAP